MDSPTQADDRPLVLLVGSFRSMINEGDDGPFGGQGGFVDTLAPEPYSLANAYLKGFVEADPAVAARYRVELLDLSEPLDLEDDVEEVELGDAARRAILAREPAIVGFSAYCWNVDAVRELAAELRRHRPELAILMGGRATDGDPDRLLEATPAVDALVVGEGEIALREILRRGARDLSGVPGVVHRDSGRVVSGGPAEIVEDLDELPSPFLGGAVSPPPNGVMMELSRGCLHSCGYCSWNSHKRLRLVSPERIEAQIRWARDAGHRHVTVTDSAINYDTEGLIRTVDAIRRADPRGDIRFTYNIRHDHVTDPQLAALARLPTHMVLLGVETLNPRAMDQVSREALDRGALRRTLAAVAEAVRPPVVSIVLGLPGDDEDGFSQTLTELMRWTRPASPGEPPLASAVLVSLLQVYRGTSLWRRRESLGLRVRERGIPYLLESPDWPADALARCKARLVELMAAEPERLKAAEAIVLMEARGGVSPWHTTRRVRSLLAEWPPGTTRDGWTLDKIGLLRDTGRGVSVRFGFEGGGGVRLLFRRRRAPDESSTGSRYYRVSREPLAGPRPPEVACERLEHAVLALVRRGEQRLAAGAAEARRRSAGT